MWRLLILAITIPLGLDLYIPVRDDNPITREKIEMGRRLFNERRLSRDASVSCSSCHNPARAFSDGRQTAIGVFGRMGPRNAPALVNRGYGRSFFRDGRSASLEEQVLKPIQDPNEMDLTLEEASARVKVDTQTLSRALSTYVRTILSGDSPYDRFINDEQFHNTGVAWHDGSLADEGRFAVTSNERDHGAFKTPTLREIARTAPYMHDGSLTTLDDVVEFYSAGGRENPYLDSEIRRRDFTLEERRALAAFLRSLAGRMTAGRQCGEDHVRDYYPRKRQGVYRLCQLLLGVE